jgi:galactokinase
MNVYKEVALQAHQQTFGQDGHAFSVPARVNLIGSRPMRVCAATSRRAARRSICWDRNGCFGGLVTSGGFGECTVNVVSAEKADSFMEIVQREYEERTGTAAHCFITEPSDGALAIAAKCGAW